MWDSHVHLQSLGPVQELVDAWPDGYRAVSCACYPTEWEKLALLTDACPEKVIPVFGLHPDSVDLWNDLHKTNIFNYLQRFQKAWIGETGLDHRYSLDAQKRVMRIQAEMALRTERPLVLHCVGKYGAMLEVLLEVGYTLQSSPVILHRFGGSAQMAGEFLRRVPVFFSLHRDSFTRDSVRQALEWLPADRILMETDGDACLGAGLSTSEKMQTLWLQARAIQNATARWPTAENLFRLCAWQESVARPASGGSACTEPPPEALR